LDDGRLVEELLIASTERLDSALGVLSIPEKRLCIEHERDVLDAGPLRTAWQQTQQH
jgi:hypothetical protein